MLSFSEIDVAKVDLLGGINFENGLVKAYYSYFSSDRATADLLAKGYAFLRKEKKNLSDLYPASTLFYFATNLNGPQLAKEIEERDFPELRQNKIAIQQFFIGFKWRVCSGISEHFAHGHPFFLVVCRSRQ